MLAIIFKKHFDQHFQQYVFGFDELRHILVD